jgi:hypothetical protein
MDALKKGGHFGNADKINTSADEIAVEVDAEMGFVNKSFEPTDDDDDGAWWEDKTGEEKEGVQVGALKSKAAKSVVKEHKLDVAPTFSLEIDENLAISESLVQSPRKTRKSEYKRNDTDESVKAVKGTRGNDNGVRQTEAGPSRMESTNALTVRNSVSAFRGRGIFAFERLFEDRAARARRLAASKWRNPWEKRWVVRKQSRRVNLLMEVDAPSVSGVATAASLSKWTTRKKRVIPVKQHWPTTYKERTKHHEGYLDVDVYSLYDMSTPFGLITEFDIMPWEDREVFQRFLQERSISFSRNWFGAFVRTKGNEKIKQPYARPRSMEMPMQHLPEDREWEEIWYTTWQRGRRSGARAKRDDGDDESDESYSPRSFASDSISSDYDEDYDDDSYYTYDDSTWNDDLPECGTLKNVKLKIGERLSLLTPTHISSLRRSRWRRKYFPRGSFPYK